jgi:hypothetical protein
VSWRPCRRQDAGPPAREIERSLGRGRLPSKGRAPLFVYVGPQADADGRTGAAGRLEHLGDEAGAVKGAAVVAEDEFQVDLG